MTAENLQQIKAELAEFLHQLAIRYGLGMSEVIQILRLVIRDLGGS